MGDIELELTRTIKAPAADVFARLADIEGHNEWMPTKGSIRRRSTQTSPGPPAVGTTYEDATVMGRIPGEIVELEPPRRLVYHWWDKTSSGRTKTEGWPGYTLESVGERETLVRHDARLRAHGTWRLATPMLRLMAQRERTAVLDALEKSFA
ncbi:hypothetical protein ASG76_07290 [Nocardioides sp. Soil774]|uniref:SRPBCC family protein n=1 Tax=Nocardioides sp. Soil774 TaxID=1736408 RepID=UPI0006F9367F|nr:SRPBCC family protein [Nocardioides sp. Soil774]KRE95444.1 hypothetical protein ASG76_07290 [Nocardioides sp. Soil774]